MRASAGTLGPLLLRDDRLVEKPADRKTTHMRIRFRRAAHQRSGEWADNAHGFRLKLQEAGRTILFTNTLY